MEHRNMNLTLTSRNINQEYMRTESVSEVNAVKKEKSLM